MCLNGFTPRSHTIKRPLTYPIPCKDTLQKLPLCGISVKTEHFLFLFPAEKDDRKQAISLDPATHADSHAAYPLGHPHTTWNVITGDHSQYQVVPMVHIKTYI